MGFIKKTKTKKKKTKNKKQNKNKSKTMSFMIGFQIPRVISSYFSLRNF